MSTTTLTAAAAPSTREFVYRKLFSFFGIAPITAYVTWHLFNNLYAVYGPEAYNERLDQVHASPLYLPLVMLLVYVPLLVHAVYGAVVTYRSRPNVGAVGTFRNWKYLLQRVSALGILGFIPAHVWKTKFSGAAMNFDHMREAMHEPLTFTVYVLAMLGVSFHLANGVWLAGITWGVWIGPEGQKRGEILSVILGAVLLVATGAILYSLRA
jgi:succinate dehydrogenase / fumarate reductase, cytochrome b subunit